MLLSTPLVFVAATARVAYAGSCHAVWRHDYDDTTIQPVSPSRPYSNDDAGKGSAPSTKPIWHEDETPDHWDGQHGNGYDGSYNGYDDKYHVSHPDAITTQHSSSSSIASSVSPSAESHYGNGGPEYVTAEPWSSALIAHDSVSATSLAFVTETSYNSEHESTACLDEHALCSHAWASSSSDGQPAATSRSSSYTSTTDSKSKDATEVSNFETTSVSVSSSSGTSTGSISLTETESRTESEVHSKTSSASEASSSSISSSSGTSEPTSVSRTSQNTSSSSATSKTSSASATSKSSSTSSFSTSSKTSSSATRTSSSVSATPTNQCTANGTEEAGYEYIIVGSGAGGAPLAARLAIAGHRTLLIEAGDDQGANDNYTVPAYQAKSTEDPEMAWDFFVRHYQDEEQQRRDFKLTYTTPEGREYTGLNPPPGSEIKGVLYPRAATLGGCTAHNALITVYPHRIDYEYMQQLTGDEAWGPDNIRRLFVRMEALGYLQGAIDITGHGLDGWFGTAVAPLTLALEDLQLTSQLVGASFALGNFTGTALNLATLLTGDANADSDLRDATPALYQIPIASANRKRNGSREFVIAVRDALNADGSKRYPLDIKMNTHVTKVTFCNNGTTPRANGVEYLEGKGIYKASKLFGQAGRGTPGSVRASREVIVAGGSYNSPQILKLSGVGPAEELSRFAIPVIKDAPGVGSNLQDHYEISVQSTFANDFPTLDGCTFGFFGQPDPCLDEWKQEPRLAGVTYDSSGFAGAALFKSSATPDGNYDVFAFGGPNNFRGYFPNYSVNATIEHNWWSWALLKGHPQNAAGTVALRSADPLDVPDIQFNFFQDGADTDLQALYESITFGRDSFARQPIPFQEQMPGPQLDTREELFQWIKDVAWSHHCSSTVKIGRDDDPMAVLDSKFRVRGVQGLRVVDASVYPKIPGTFTAVSTYLVGEKAADDILEELGERVETPLGLILRLGDLTVDTSIDINNITALLESQVDRLRLGELGSINLNITLGGNRD